MKSIPTTEKVIGGFTLFGIFRRSVPVVDGFATDIAASAKSQAIGLAEVNTAADQMDQVAQQNGAIVAQSTAAGHALAQEPEALTRLIAQFKINETSAQTAHEARRALAPVSPSGTPAADLSAPARSHRHGGAAGDAQRSPRGPTPLEFQNAHEAHEAWKEF